MQRTIALVLVAIVGPFVFVCIERWAERLLLSRRERTTVENGETR